MGSLESWCTGFLWINNEQKVFRKGFISKLPICLVQVEGCENGLWSSLHWLTLAIMESLKKNLTLYWGYHLSLQIIKSKVTQNNSWNTFIFLPRWVSLCTENVNHTDNNCAVSQKCKIQTVLTSDNDVCCCDRQPINGPIIKCKISGCPQNWSCSVSLF